MTGSANSLREIRARAEAVAAEYAPGSVWVDPLVTVLAKDTLALIEVAEAAGLRLDGDPAPRVKPWWCSCDSGGGFGGVHESWCYGEQEDMPRLNAALRQREALADLAVGESASQGFSEGASSDET